MEFKVSSQELLKSISDVSKAIPGKAALAILENFLFVLKGNELDTKKAAALFLDDFRSGKLGRITLEFPGAGKIS